MKPLTIGQLARRAGVGVETVRFYQRRGLIEEPPRLGSGHRRYPPEMASRIRFIRRAQELGFSLGETKELLTLKLTPETDPGEMGARLRAKVADIEEKIRRLRSLKDPLLRLIGSCSELDPPAESPLVRALDHKESTA
jgi:DNA-binding transcriptional MerR regulator